MSVENSGTHRESHESDYDPVYLHSRREALIIFGVWVAAFCWSVPYCYLNGYPPRVDPDTFATVWGMPAWVFWGIVVPWLVADLVTIWICFFYIADDDLGEAHEGADVAQDRQERHAAGGLSEGEPRP